MAKIHIWLFDCHLRCTVTMPDQSYPKDSYHMIHQTRPYTPRTTWQKNTINYSPNTQLKGNICLAWPTKYSALGNCAKKLGRGWFVGPPLSLTATGLYAAFFRARCPHNPAIQHINTVTTHWNHVTNSGAGIDIPSLDIRTLLRYTMEMETTQ